MVKFFKVKDTEVRRAIEVDEAGNKVKVLAIIGQVKELVAREIIFEDNTAGNGEKWLVIPSDQPDHIREYNEYAAAKASVINA